MSARRRSLAAPELYLVARDEAWRAMQATWRQHAAGRGSFAEIVAGYRDCASEVDALLERFYDQPDASEDDPPYR